MRGFLCILDRCGFALSVIYKKCLCSTNVRFLVQLCFADVTEPKNVRFAAHQQANNLTLEWNRPGCPSTNYISHYIVAYCNGVASDCHQPEGDDLLISVYQIQHHYYLLTYGYDFTPEIECQFKVCCVPACTGQMVSPIEHCYSEQVLRLFWVLMRYVFDEHFSYEIFINCYGTSVACIKSVIASAALHT